MKLYRYYSTHNIYIIMKNTRQLLNELVNYALEQRILLRTGEQNAEKTALNISDKMDEVEENITEYIVAMEGNNLEEQIFEDLECRAIDYQDDPKMKRSFV